jgi:hypothetical protein
MNIWSAISYLEVRPKNEESKTKVPKDLSGLEELSLTQEENKTKVPRDFRGLEDGATLNPEEK